MKRIELISLLLCFGLGFPSISLAAEQFRPNLIIFLVDDMGIMDTSVPFLTDKTGRPQRYPLNQFYRTPNMERLAERGIRFNQFCAMSVCSPTRISLMTGQNAARHKTTNWINPDQNNRGPFGPPEWNWMGLNKASITLPRLLQQAGYRTIHIGKGHFGPRHSEGADPRNLGFDINIAGSSIGAPGSYYGTNHYGGLNKVPSQAVPHLDKFHGSPTFLTEALTLEAKSQMTASMKAGLPFFLYLAHYAVHAPFNSDSRFAHNYVDSGKPPAAQAFATLIEGMDKSLGDILDHLEALGVADNTLIFFLGDNGSDAPLGSEHEVACAAPLRGKKGSHYEGGTRVPFMAAWAKADRECSLQQRLPIPCGVIQNQLATVCDIFPTILALTDIQPPAQHTMDGHRLDSLLAGRRDPNRPQEFLMHYPHSPHRTDYFTTYRCGDWKIIYHYFPSKVSDGAHYQLFNLADDPSEQANLSVSHPGQLKLLMQGLLSTLEKYQALYPLDQGGSCPLKPAI